MQKILKSVNQKLGIDKAIVYTVTARMIQAIGGFGTLICIAKNLTKIEQGYYYTFSSLLAIQIFFELGLNTIITQYVAHEAAFLVLKDNYTLEGNEASQSRLAHLLHFCLKWFSVISLALFLIVLTAGYLFFHNYNNHVAVKWLGPWFILSATTAGFFLLDPLIAFLEGLGQVQEAAKYRLYQQVSYVLSVVVLLQLRFGLYAPAFAALVSLLIVAVKLFFSDHRKLLLFIWQQKNKWKINYRTEIFPYQWKIALSWISGYFIYQLFNPVLFATAGAVVAGQMGMTLTALSGIAALSGSWINTKIPLFSNLISLQKFDELDVRFNKAFLQSLFIVLLGLGTLLTLVLILQSQRFEIGKRFLPLFPFCLLIVIAFINQINYSLSAYLRCHKKEPLVVQSAVIALLSCLSTFILGNLYGVNGITLGYLALVSIGLPWTVAIYRNKKSQWHLQESTLS